MRGNTPIGEILKVLKKYNTGTRCFSVEIYDDESGMIKRTDGKLWESFTDLDDCLAILKQHFMIPRRHIDALNASCLNTTRLPTPVNQRDS